MFADFVTAVITNDLDATFSLYDKFDPQNSSSKRLSFRKENQNQTCESWPHFYFSFSRPAIADKFFKITKTNEEKKVLIINFYKFISEDLIKTWNAQHKQIDCYQANAQLIEKLNRP